MKKKLRTVDQIAKDLSSMNRKDHKLAWICDVCGWLMVSDTSEHHKMDTCRCPDNSGCSVDLEYYSCRFNQGKQGQWPRIIARQDIGKKWKIVYRNRKKVKNK